MFNQILVGVDEREGGRDAIALAKHLVAADGQITLVFVETSEPEVYRGVRVMYEASERECMLDRLRKAREQAHIDAEVTYVEARSGERASRCRGARCRGSSRSRLLSAEPDRTGPDP